MRYLPVPSILTAPAGTCAVLAGAMDAIFPSATTTVRSARTVSRSIGSTFTPTNAVVVSWAPRWLAGDADERAAAATATRTETRWLAGMPGMVQRALPCSGSARR